MFMLTDWDISFDVSSLMQMLGSMYILDTLAQLREEWGVLSLNLPRVSLFLFFFLWQEHFIEDSNEILSA